MKIVIRSYLAASHQLEREPGEWSTIVILDSGLAVSPFVAEHAKEAISLTFDDIVAAEGGKISVHESHLRRAVQFAPAADQLLVSCRAGQSRSAAIAFVIAYHRHGSATALSLLDPTRHIPNHLVVRTGSVVTAKPEMLADLEEWKRCHGRKSLADFYDDIEAEVEALERQGAKNRVAG